MKKLSNTCAQCACLSISSDRQTNKKKNMKRVKVIRTITKAKYLRIENIKHFQEDGNVGMSATRSIFKVNDCVCQLSKPIKIQI